MTPTILATCGGWRPHDWHDLEFSPLQRYALDLTGVTGRRIRMAFVATAGGDQRHEETRGLTAAADAGVDARYIRFFGRNEPDLDAVLDDVDLVWVEGGSVVNLLAVWRAHGFDGALRRAWERGVVLAGTSAGALCWHAGGPTSSFGPGLASVTDALGFIPESLAVHYDSQPRRRPLYHDDVAAGVLPPGHGIDEGVGLLYRGTDLVEVLAESDGAAWRVESDGSGGAAEHRITPRRLPER